MNGSKSLPIQVARKDLKKEGWNERGGLKHIIKTYYPVKPPDIAKCEVAKRTVPSASLLLLLCFSSLPVGGKWMLFGSLIV